MAKKKKKNIKDDNTLLVPMIVLLSCILVVFLIIVSLKKDNVSENDVMLLSKVENVSINDLLPATEVFGKQISNNDSSSYGYYEFEVFNLSTKVREFQVYINKNSMGTNEINNDYVVFYLTDENNNPVGVFEDDNVLSYKKLKYLKDKPDSKLIYDGKIDSKSLKKFKLRIWVADNYISESENYFSVDIGVRAI